MHRVICHDIPINKSVGYVAVFIGLLTHAGGIKNSALSHYQHHQHTDVSTDVNKTFGITAKLNTLSLQSKRQIIGRINNDRLLKILDSKFYLFFIGFYFTITCIFGIDAIIYVLAPASFSMFIHNYVAVKWLHGRFGYTNFNISDNSKNSILFFPLMFGENWHNNHHGMLSNSTRLKWWELDLIDLLCKPFYKKQ